LYLSRGKQSGCRRDNKSIYSLLVDEFDKFVAFGLGIRLHVTVVNQPGTDFGVGPGTPDNILSIREIVTRDV
jgi:hypothetical protein